MFLASLAPTLSCSFHHYNGCIVPQIVFIYIDQAYNFPQKAQQISMCGFLEIGKMHYL